MDLRLHFRRLLRGTWHAWLGAIAVCLSGGLSHAQQAAVPAEVDYNRDVRPILAARCFACHGPDDSQREAELRLDDSEAATRDRGGYRVIDRQQPEASELLRRVQHGEADERMPPPESGEPLTAGQIDILRRWIRAGAPYAPHWAFIPPRRTPLASLTEDGGARAWARQPIDYFVWQRLRAAGWEPAPVADPYTLVRRLYLDLIGLPPTPEQVDAFVQDPDPLAYERLVDQLLASPQYGERWARRWLDLARYADTNGYEKDRPRSIWPSRDWVIQALNDDMPFDQFSIEQLAGDMLPEATSSQRIATGFHRNTMLNEEGGIDPLEYRFHAMVDRVAVTGTVWLGLTIGCAQCHTHKYDPLTHTDYYRFFGLLNNADEPDWLVEQPAIVQRRQQIEAQLQLLQTRLAEQFPPDDGPGSESERRMRHLSRRWEQWLNEQRPRAVDWQPALPTHLQSNLPRLSLLSDGSIFSSGDITKRDVFELTYRRQAESQDGVRVEKAEQPAALVAPHSSSADRAASSAAASSAAASGGSLGRPEPPAELPLPTSSRLPEQITALRLEVLPDDRLPARGPGRAYYEGRKGDFFLSEVTAVADGKPVRFASASHSFGKISIGSGSANAENVFDGDGSTGWSTSGREGEAHHLVLVFAEPLTVQSELKLSLLFERHFAASLGRFRVSFTTAAQPRAANLPVEVEAILTKQQVTWTPAEQQQMRNYFLEVAPELAGVQAELAALRKQLPELPTTLILQERPQDYPRPTFRHHRGEYLQPREQVEPGLPSLFLAPLGASATRSAAVSAAAAGVPAGAAQAANPSDASNRNKPSQSCEPSNPSGGLTAGSVQTPPNSAVAEQNATAGDTPSAAAGPAAAQPAAAGPAAREAGGESGVATGVPRDRLALAQWLVSDRNPLVGRVVVNRVWQDFFGFGLVRTDGDFGTLSEPPTHPELLDWLAVEWMSVPAETAGTEGTAEATAGSPVAAGQGNLSWSMKRLHRLIVTSATYRQQSSVSAERLALDPTNRLLGRGPRLRVEAEVVRDTLLQASGLLTWQVGGPSVYPPQPTSVTALAYGNPNWPTSSGAARYRRSLYTFSRRTAPFAAYTVFDGPTGEACLARRDRSNTPLQALSLLNDEMFLEMARALGDWTVDSSTDSAARLTFLFRRLLTRPPTEDEQQQIRQFLAAQVARLERGELNAAKILGRSDVSTPAPAGTDSAPAPAAAAASADDQQRASWVLVARALMNLDEAITKP